MRYESRHEKLNRHYRKVEAMLRRGYSIDEILLECPELERLDVLDIDQKIFIRDMIKRERGY